MRAPLPNATVAGEVNPRKLMIVERFPGTRWNFWGIMNPVQDCAPVIPARAPAGNKTANIQQEKCYYVDNQGRRAIARLAERGAYKGLQGGSQRGLKAIPALERTA